MPHEALALMYQETPRKDLGEVACDAATAAQPQAADGRVDVRTARTWHDVARSSDGLSIAVQAQPASGFPRGAPVYPGHGGAPMECALARRHAQRTQAQSLGSMAIDNGQRAAT